MSRRIAHVRSVSPPAPTAGSWRRGRTQSDRRRHVSRSPGSTACAGRTCATRPPSLISGRPCARGSTTRSSLLPTTRHLTRMSSSRVAQGTGCVRHVRRSLAPSSLLARNGESTRRSYPTSAGSFAFRCVTTTPVRRGSVRAHRARRRGRGMAADIAIRRHVMRPRCRALGQTGRSVVRATLAGRRARPTSTRQTAHCTTDSDMLETVGTVRRSAWSWAADLLRRRISRCCRRAADAPLQASCPSATLCIRARRRPQRVKLPAGSPGLRRSCHRGHRIRLSKCVHKTGSRPQGEQRHVSERMARTGRHADRRSTTFDNISRSWRCASRG